MNSHVATARNSAATNDPFKEIQRLGGLLDESEKQHMQARAQLALLAEACDTLRRERDWALQALADLKNETFLELARNAEQKDGESPMHTTRIGLYSGMIAAELGWSPDMCQLLESAAQLHDIGKIGIHASILGKEGPLTTEEWRVMREHPRIGASIIGDSEEPLLKLAAEIAMSHHEHFDGAGYPQGLVGREIPMAGRIVALADFFDALTTHRSYRPARPAEEVVEMVKIRSGEQFDPLIVDAFLRISDQIITLRQSVLEQERYDGAQDWDGNWWMLL
ncbi:HD domain-containing phosphohydrolase [Zoogloea sp.]|uniref:HD-GYP domain-containing protein n=1 Tax=Zoogloea sp. TaxID=49181 RepID=UPI00262FE5D3|nr:HD domain-containing phosphohydrolase [Zoogloea sp.]MDD3354838.1 HD domain-containing protein [Zoogloea sp.]